MATFLSVLHLATAGLNGPLLGSDEEEIVLICLVVVNIQTHQVTYTQGFAHSCWCCSYKWGSPLTNFTVSLRPVLVLCILYSYSYGGVHCLSLAWDKTLSLSILYFLTPWSLRPLSCLSLWIANKLGGMPFFHLPVAAAEAALRIQDGASVSWPPAFFPFSLALSLDPSLFFLPFLCILFVRAVGWIDNGCQFHQLERKRLEQVLELVLLVQYWFSSNFSNRDREGHPQVCCFRNTFSFLFFF